MSGHWWRSVINLGGVQAWDHLSPSFNPPFSFPLVDSPGGLDRARWSADTNILMQFIQSNRLINSTLMFNVLPGTEISVHAEFSHCQKNWYYGLQAMYSSMALKSGGPCTFGPPHCQKGVRAPTGSPPLCLVSGCRHFVEVIQVLNSKIMTLCQFCILVFMVYSSRPWPDTVMSFSTLMLLFGHQERQPVFKNIWGT